jgi:hypothetical protein
VTEIGCLAPPSIQPGWPYRAIRRCPLPRRQAQRPRRSAHRWYGLNRWRAAARAQLRTEPLCAACLAKGKVTAGRWSITLNTTPAIGPAFVSASFKAYARRVPTKSTAAPERRRRRRRGRLAISGKSGAHRPRTRSGSCKRAWESHIPAQPNSSR